MKATAAETRAAGHLPQDAQEFIATRKETAVGESAVWRLYADIVAGGYHPLVFPMWQPWATLVVARDVQLHEPPKQHETRPWRPPPARLPMCVAIHAAKRWGLESHALASSEPFDSVLWRCGYRLPGSRTNLKTLPLGAVIGLAIVDRVYSTDELRPLLELTARNPRNPPARLKAECELAFGNYSPGRYAFRLRFPLELPKPIPYRANQAKFQPFGKDDVLAMRTLRGMIVANI